MGASGRPGVLDASECPPAFGVDSGSRGLLRPAIGRWRNKDGFVRKAIEALSGKI